jgi:outer membrane protein OmpA-like peptidoglycan-associated protein
LKEAEPRRRPGKGTREAKVLSNWVPRADAEMKAREEKLAEERKKLAVWQAKAEAMEREKNMLAAASKIPNVTVKTGEKEMVLAILAINIFTPATELKPQGKEILGEVGTFLKAYPHHKVIVQGIPTVGKQEVNQTLSEKRAQKVREYLVAYQDIQPARVTAEGVGPSRPVATNSTDAGRALNRRVEIAIQTGH